MVLGSKNKRTRKQVIDENRRQGAATERKIKLDLELAGWTVKKTGKGSDFYCTRKRMFSDKVDVKYVDGKSGKAKLSKLQQKKKKQYGGKYKVIRRMSDREMFGASRYAD